MATRTIFSHVNVDARASLPPPIKLAIKVRQQEKMSFIERANKKKKTASM
jgi:hypothetical protein